MTNVIELVLVWYMYYLVLQPVAVKVTFRFFIVLVSCLFQLVKNKNVACIKLGQLVILLLAKVVNIPKLLI